MSEERSELPGDDVADHKEDEIEGEMPDDDATISEVTGEEDEAGKGNEPKKKKKSKKKRKKKKKNKASVVQASTDQVKKEDVEVATDQIKKEESNVATDQIIKEDSNVSADQVTEELTAREKEENTRRLLCDPVTGKFDNITRFIFSTIGWRDQNDPDKFLANKEKLVMYKWVYRLIGDFVRPKIASSDQISLICHMLRTREGFAAVAPLVAELKWDR